MKRILLTTALVGAALLAAPPCRAASFLTDNAGNRLTDQIGSPLVVLAGSHNVYVSSSWPPKNVFLILVADYTDDLSGIQVVGYANVVDSTVTLTQTQLLTVDSAGNVKVLQTCPAAPRCEFTIAKATMHPGSNDVWLLATTASGERYGATTKMSPP